MPYDLITVQENVRRPSNRLAAQEAERARAWAEARRASRRPRRGPSTPRATPEQVRERARKRTFTRYANATLEDPNCPAIKRLRLERELTLRDVAAQSQVGGRMVVWRAENEPHLVSDAAWSKLAVFYGVSVEAIKP